MIDVKHFTERVLKIARQRANRGELVTPVAFFLLPSGEIDTRPIAPEFMRDPTSKNELSLLLNYHRRRTRAPAVVLLSDVWVASWRRGKRPDHRAKRSEALIATAWGTGIPAWTCIQPYSRDVNNRRVWGAVEWFNQTVSRFTVGNDTT